MEQLRALIADAQAYLAAASAREKRLVALAAGGVALFIVLIAYASFASSIHKAEATLDEKRGEFDKISRLAAGYGAQEQERQLLEARLRQSPPTLMSFVDGIAKQSGIEIGGMSDRGVISGGQNGRPRESSVEVNLSKIPLEKLAAMLQAIERSPGVVRVRRLRVRKSFDNKDVLDVTMTVSAWQGT
jgi:general secretion pathway protein M